MTGPNTAAPPVSLTQAVAALQQKRGAKPRARTQADIVADNADTIIELVRRYGATQKEVADTLRELGEPVRDDGFAAEMRKQLGTMKEIRTVRTSDPAKHDSSAVVPSTTAGVQPYRQDEAFEEDSFVTRPARI